MRSLWWSIAFGAAALFSVAGQTPARVRILGVFNHAGDAIEGAEVIDILTQTKALTTKTGTVSLGFLGDSGSLIRIQKIGFRPQTMVVAMAPTDTLPITVVLDEVGTVLPTVFTTDSSPRYVSPGLRAFEERRKQGFGQFITEAELRKNDSKRMTNMVRTLSNVNLACPRGGLRRGECWAVGARSGCPLVVYLNGAVSTDNDLEKLQVSEFGGVEYYPGGATIPPQYNKTGSACGVLLLWTRER